MTTQKLLLILLCLVNFIGHSQITTVTFTQSNEYTVKDAMIASNGLANSNFGASSTMNVFNDNSSSSVVQRTMLEFGLSSIPSNAVITDAKLTLYPQTINQSVNFSYSLERAVANWSSTNVTWNTQPASYSSDRIEFAHPATANPNQHIIDVKGQVQNMVSYPYNNHGWVIKLSDESNTSNSYGASFHSSESATTGKRPSLEISYILPIEVNYTITHCTSGNEDGSATIHLSKGSNAYNYCSVNKIERDPNQIAQEIVTFISSTTTITNNTIQFTNLSPGLYEVLIKDSLHIGGNTLYNKTYHQKCSYFLVGREGEETNCILANTRAVSAVQVLKNISNQSATNDWQNTNQHAMTNKLGIAYTGTNSIGSSSVWSYENESLMDFNIDFSASLDFSKANLYLYGWTSYHQRYNSSNAAYYTVVTEPWNQRVVTWNSKPNTDTTHRVYSPKTAVVHGNTPERRDTVDMLSLITYWQSNPNHGFEMAIENYNQPTYSNRSHKKLLGNDNGFLELTFSVKEPIITEFNDSTGLGSITVNAPAGNLPYTYLIGYDTIPELNVIWQSIKDSVDIDSAYFFSGKENSTTFTFDNLEGGNYFIAVFDNQGQRILEGLESVSNELRLIETTAILTDNNTIKYDITKTQTGTGTVFGSLTSFETGGLGFVVKTKGVGTIGFNELTSSLSSNINDFEFAVSFTSEGTCSISKEGVALKTISFNEGDRFDLLLENANFKLIVNDQIAESISINPVSTEGFRIDMLMEPLSDLLLEKVKYKKNFKWFLSPFEVMHPTVCEEEGSIVYAEPMADYQLTLTVVNVSTGVSTTYNPTSFPFTLNLGVGTYVISDSYYNSVFGASIIGTTQQVSIGNTVIWNQSTAINQVFSPITSVKNAGGASNGSSTSLSTIDLSSDGWLSYKYRRQPFELSPTNTGTYGQMSVLDAGNNNANVISIRIVSSLNGNLLNSGIIQILDPNNNNIVYSGFQTYNGENLTISYNQSTSTLKVLKNTIEIASLSVSGLSGPLSFGAQTGPYTELYDIYTSTCQFGAIDFIAKTKYVINGSYYDLNNGQLKFQYTGEYNLSDLKYELTDYTGQVMNGMISLTTFQTNNIDKKNADNRFVLTEIGTPSLNSGYYMLKITNPKNEEQFIRIRKE